MINDLDYSISIFLETNSSDYYYGLSLVSQVCRNKTLLSNLRRKQSQVNHDKLLYELNKYLISINYEQKESEITEQYKNNQNFNDKSQNSEFGAGVESEPGTSKEAISEKRNDFNTKRYLSNSSHINNTLFSRVKAIEIERNKLYGLRDSYHGQLHGKTTKKERFELAKSIIELGPKIDKLNSRLKTIYAEGKLEEVDVKSTLSVKANDNLKNYKIYVARYKNKASKAKTIEKKHHFEAKSDEYQLKINKILGNE